MSICMPNRIFVIFHQVSITGKTWNFQRFSDLNIFQAFTDRSSATIATSEAPPFPTFSRYIIWNFRNWASEPAIQSFGQVQNCTPDSEMNWMYPVLPSAESKSITMLCCEIKKWLWNELGASGASICRIEEHFKAVMIPFDEWNAYSVHRSPQYSNFQTQNHLKVPREKP